MVCFIIFALIAALSLIYSLKITVGAVKNKVIKIDYLPLIKKVIIIGIIFVVAMTGMFIGIHLWSNNNPVVSDWLQTIFGGLFFSLFAYVSLHTFIIHYYGHKVPDDINKKLFISLAVAFPLTVVTMLVLLNGFADYVSYPLVSGLNFSTGWVTPSNGKASITFYALCILSGAIYVYFYCDHKMYVQYGKHGILESTFLIAFPAGIIGARLFYVIGQNDIGSFFNFRDGGLTILGGAITGIVVGVAWFLWRNKKYNIWVAVDIIVPAILIAQAVGRWGNFFNCEVHGGLVPEEYWRWLPKIIFNNAHYSSSTSGGVCPSGYLYAPLFFIEGIINLLGFFILAHLFGHKLRKYTEFGDLAFGYVLWYGLVRVFMEPLRDSAYIMKDAWSFLWSFVFIAVGALLIAMNHFIRYLSRRKKGTLKVNNNTHKNGIRGTVIVSICSLALITVGIILMSTNKFVAEVRLNNFNIGLIFLVLGISFSFGLFITIPKIISYKNYSEA